MNLIRQANRKTVMKYISFMPASARNTALSLAARLRPRVKNYVAYTKATAKLSGVEIGGPTALFHRHVPVYKECLSLDFVNFSNETIWEGQLTDSVNYFGNKFGKQYIMEASELPKFADNCFDFLLSSNCLEHIANPIKALSEWKRVTSGEIILIVPRKDNNFDHRRPTTTFEHLVADYNNDIDETDLTHLSEILSLHDLDRDPPAGSYEQFHQRSLDNFNNRCLHHHVFDNDLVSRMCEYLGMSIIEQSVDEANWFFLIDTRS